MAFWGRSFIYDGVPSETYGLLIQDIDADAVNRSMASSAMEIAEKKIYRVPTPYFYGMTPSPKLEFSFSAYSDSEMDASMFELASKWLFSSRQYKILQIDQYDMQDVIFYCIFQDAELARVGNLIQGFSATVLCNSPFAFKYPKTTTYTYTVSVVDQTEIYYNTSDDSGSYLIPSQMIVTMNNISGGFTITNLDDDSRQVSFTGLSADEVLTISPQFQTIQSSTGLLRLSNSNKKFLRLVPGVNRLRIQGNVLSFSMTNSDVCKKISG